MAPTLLRTSNMISSLQRARITFWIGFALALCILFPFWRPLGAGLILGYLSEDAVAYMVRRFRLRRWGRMFTAAALVALVLLFFLIPIGLVLYKAGRELMQAARSSNGDFALGAESWSTALERWLHDRLVQWNLSLLTAVWTVLGPRLQQAGAVALSSLLGWLKQMLSATPGALLDLVIAVLVWWLAADGGAAQRERVLRWLLPWPGPRAILGRAVSDVLHGLIVANLIVAAIQAAICGASLAIFSVPRAFSLGLLSFFLAFVPVIGTAAVTVGAAIYLFMHGRIGAGLIMLLVALFAGVIDNLLRPFFLRGRLELPIAWIFLSIMGGIAGLGAAGIVIGPIVLSVCRAALLALEQESAPPPGSEITGHEAARAFDRSVRREGSARSADTASSTSRPAAGDICKDLE
jgi:predicted PurR-regulated permease PerM